MDQTTPLPLEAKQKKPANPAKRKKLALLGGSLLIVAVVPLVLKATLKTPVEDARHKEVAEMTERERARLEHNYERFQKLTEAEKAQYRKLHQELEVDQSDLKQLLKRYEDWLRELPLWQRDEINKQTDPAAKARLVAHYADEQRERDAQEKELLSNVLDFSPPRPGNEPGSSRFLRLSAEDLSDVVDVLENHLKVDERPSRTLTGLARYEWVLKKSMLASTPSGSTPQRFFPHWPNAAIMEKVIGAISDDRIARKLDEISSPNDLRRMIRALVANGLSGELMREFYRSLPKEEELQEFIQGLDKEKLDQFTAMSPGRAKGELTKWYLMEKRSKPPKEVLELRKLIYDLYMRKPGRFGSGRGPGNGSPNRPDDRDRGERPRPEDRGERPRPGGPRGSFPGRDRERDNNGE